MRLIADHTLPHVILQWAGIASLLVLTAGAAIVFYRRGRVEGLSKALETADAERHVYEKRADRLERDLHESREACSSAVAHLEGVVSQLREENATLRALVMGETLPPALAAALEGVAASSRAVTRTMLAELTQDYLEPIRRAVGTRALDETGGGQ